MQQRIMGAAVAAACASLELATAQGRAERSAPLAKAANEQAVAKRRLTVDLRIEAEAGDDSPLAPLVGEALAEFLNGDHAQTSGKFESKAGLDVSWVAHNDFYDRDGNLVHTDRAAPGMPLIHVDAKRGVVTINGIDFSPVAFEWLTNPNPAKRFSFERQGSNVIVHELKD